MIKEIKSEEACAWHSVIVERECDGFIWKASIQYYYQFKSGEQLQCSIETTSTPSASPSVSPSLSSDSPTYSSSYPTRVPSATKVAESISEDVASALGLSQIVFGAILGVVSILVVALLGLLISKPMKISNSSGVSTFGLEEQREEQDTPRPIRTREEATPNLAIVASDIAGTHDGELRARGGTVVNILSEIGEWGIVKNPITGEEGRILLENLKRQAKP